MKTSELRIGNYIELDNEGYLKVIGITDFYQQVSVEYPDGEKRTNEDLENYKPIPLTEEWLLKFGFEYIKGCKKTMCDIFGKNGINLSMSNSGNFYYNKLLIESVHQLQNLFFVLTNEELTLKQD